MASYARNPPVTDGDTRAKLIISKKKKRDFDYLTSSVLMEHQKHLLASLHFKAIYDRLLFVPSIGITLGSGILAVIAQSGLYSEHTQSVCTIWIAILAAFSVFWQSLIKQLDFGGRASLHDSAASSLSKIFKLARMRSREQRIVDLESFGKPKNGSEQTGSDEGGTYVQGAEENVPVVAEVADREDGSTAGGEANTLPPVSAGNVEDHFTLSKQFEQALQGCTSVVPVRITAAFNALDSRINVCNKKMVSSANVKPQVAWEKVFPALYYQMALTIIGSRWWPYRVPDSDWAVEKTIRDFQGMDACLLKTLVSRAQEIDNEYGNLATESTPLIS